MNRTLKALSVLMAYPTRDLKEAASELRAVMAADHVLSDVTKSAVVTLIDDLARQDLIASEERYVHLFDRTRTLSLHLFEHVHGESRDRGQAMVDLKEMYERDGFEIAASEMPDYLPMFLEYLSVRPAADIRDMLGQTLHIVSALKERLVVREPIYAGLFSALEELAGSKPDMALLSELLAIPADDPDDLGALDKIWEEEAVTFGGNAGDGVCGPDRLRSQIRASRRPPAEPTLPAQFHEG